MMEKGFQEFKQQLMEGSTYNHKVTGSWGVYDAYRHIRKNKWYNIGKPLTRHDFYLIIRSINKLLAQELSSGQSIKFPERMGELVLHKYQPSAKMVKGKLKVNYPIDWNQTLHLWYNDEEAKKKKVLLRNENPWVYHVKYLKDEAIYENKIFYQFSLNTFIKRALSQNIKQGNVDTIW